MKLPMMQFIVLGIFMLILAITALIWSLFMGAFLLMAFMPLVLMVLAIIILHRIFSSHIKKFMPDKK